MAIKKQKTTGPAESHDLVSPTANMFGIEPCPKCGDEHRVPHSHNGPSVIECYECGYVVDHLGPKKN